MKRRKALLPSVQLISVLLEPGERAYSWYQHQKAHTIETALQHSFYEVITSEPGTPEYNLRQVSQMQVRIMTHSFQFRDVWNLVYMPGIFQDGSNDIPENK